MATTAQASSLDEGSSRGPAGLEFDRFSDDDYCHIHRWYPDLIDLTFETVVSHVTGAEAQAIVRAHEQVLMLRRAVRFGMQPDEVERMREQCRWRNDATLVQLAQRVHHLVEGFTEGAFVRLCTRSPKDSALSSNRMKELLRDEIARRPVAAADDDHDDTSVQDVIAYIRCSSKALCVFDGDTAIDLFVQSDRVHQDLSMMLLRHTDLEFQVEMVVRRWDARIDPEYEFRVFVVDNAISAVSQYYDLCYVPEIAAHRNEIRERIDRYFVEQVRDRVRIPTYTVDLALSPTSEHIWLIELNHPPPLAGTALFDWYLDSDQAILHAKAPREFRVLQEPLGAKVMARLEPTLRSWIAELRGKPSALHLHVTCDACRQSPVVGIVYHCIACAAAHSFDICAACFEAFEPAVTHEHPKDAFRAFDDADAFLALVQQQQQHNASGTSSMSNTSRHGGGSRGAQRRCCIA